MNWLISGGCGFIGRAVISAFQKQAGNKVRVLDNLSVGRREDLAGIVDFMDLKEAELREPWRAPIGLVEGDIRDADCVNAAMAGADVIIHLAANTGVAPSVADPHADCEANVIGTLNMLEACRKSSAKRFVFASSGAPLGVQVPPLHEEMAPHPASPYGASKLAGEGYCSAYYHCFGIETVILRFGNVYGEGSRHKQSVVAKFIKQALDGECLEIFGDGTQTRDFIHISDLTDAILRAATVPDVGGETFQIATARETTVSEMTDALIEALRAESQTEPETFFGPKRDGDVMRNYSDTIKARERLGWAAQVTLEDGLRRTIRYFLDARRN